ncbi:hypothetical protein HDU97_001138 [Phlyctochytrium planicorne]|nr:hypothetical protein HDU97_001138 [Phlyctochytrium planicorne]
MKQHGPFHKQVIALRTELRDCYVQMFLNDYEQAQASGVENLLWINVHYNVIQEYRKKEKDLKSLKSKTQQHPDKDGKQDTSRDISASFRLFLKQSQSFYLGFIYQLAHRYNLERVLATMRMTFAMAGLHPKQVNAVSIDDAQRARYQETPNGLKEKVLSGARRYYVLAVKLAAYNGNPFSQLGLIDILEGDELSAIDNYLRRGDIETMRELCVSEFKQLLRSRGLPVRSLVSVMVVNWSILYYVSHKFEDRDLSNYRKEAFAFAAQTANAILEELLWRSSGPQATESSLFLDESKELVPPLKIFLKGLQCLDAFELQQDFITRWQALYELMQSNCRDSRSEILDLILDEDEFNSCFPPLRSGDISYSADSFEVLEGKSFTAKQSHLIRISQIYVILEKLLRNLVPEEQRLHLSNGFYPSFGYTADALQDHNPDHVPIEENVFSRMQSGFNWTRDGVDVEDSEDMETIGLLGITLPHVTLCSKDESHDELLDNSGQLSATSW